MTVRSARSLNNELASDLHDAAFRLSPVAEHQASESGCTNTRPTGVRTGRAWDMVRLCHHLNSFCDNEDLSAAFIAVTEGKPLVVPPVDVEHDHDAWHCSHCFAVEELNDAVALWNALFPKGFGTPLERAKVAHQRAAKRFEAAQQHFEDVQGSRAEWDARRDLDRARNALQRATQQYNDRL